MGQGMRLLLLGVLSAPPPHIPTPPPTPPHTPTHIHTYICRKKREPESFDEGDEKLTLGGRVREFLQSLRYFRIFIALWNIVVIICMFV